MRSSLRTLLNLLGFSMLAVMVYAFLFWKDLFIVVCVAYFVFCVAFFLISAIVTAVSRVRSGKHIFTPRCPEAIFQQRCMSGRSHQKLLLWRCSASNCLWSVVLHDRLIVGSMFPFSLTTRIPCYFDYDLHKSQIAEVTESFQGVFRTTVLVRFQLGEAEERIDLVMRNADQFFAAMRELSEDIAINRIESREVGQASG